MTQGNLVIERYYEGNLSVRSDIRRVTISSLLSSKGDVLNDEAFHSLIEDESSDMVKQKEGTEEGKVNPLCINTLSKAVKSKKGLSDLGVSDLRILFVKEIASHPHYTTFFIDLMDWTWRTVLDVKDMSTNGVRKRSLTYIFQSILGMSDFDIYSKEDWEVHSVLENVYNEYIPTKGYTSERISALYCLLANALLYYREGDLINFKYFLMKVSEINYLDSPCYFVIEFLVNQLIIHE